MTRRPEWLNQNVIGMSVTSFFSGAGHEMVTAVLPGFLPAIGVTAAALGWIEGASDAASNLVRVGAGWYSDRIGHRKGIVAFGYFRTGTALALFAFAVSWPLLLIGRLISWFGRGIRSPLRDAMLSESVSPAVHGKAFGLHRAAGTIGAVVGPLIGMRLLRVLPAPTISSPFRTIFLLSLIPGLAAPLSFVLMVKEQPGNRRATRFWTAIRSLPRNCAIPAGMISPDSRGTAYGVLGSVNGAGDLIASALVGTLRTAVSPAVAFSVAGVLMLAGSFMMMGASKPGTHE
jgi:MFS family permease